VGALVGVGLSTAKAAVAVMIYRLISLWLLVVVGWIIYFVLRSRRARRAAAETPPALPVAFRWLTSGLPVAYQWCVVA
jgi:Flp pilus assembly protein TadB